MARDEARFSPNVGSLYSYVEVDRWTVTPTHCTYRQWGGITSSYGWGFTGYCTLQWWEDGTWRDAADEVSKWYGGNGDEEYDFIPSDSFVRTDTDRVVSLGNYAHAYVNGTSTSARAWIDFTVPHLPNAPTSLTASYDAANTPNQITLSWTSPTRSCENLRLEVQIDGGSWSELPSISASATSYTYAQVTDDHSYKFRMRAYYQNAYSSYTSETSAITTKPAPPQSIATAAAGGTSVTVTLVNPSNTATKVQYQISDDDGATWGAVQDSSNLTTFSVSISGTGKVKAWNYNSTGVSEAITSDTIVTICPPAPPTITSPQGNVWDVSQPLTVSWLHNSLDGSEQTAAKVTLVKAGAPIVTHVETLDPFTGNSKSISLATAQTWINGLTIGDTLNVAVKTKGADASYSSNSVARGIKLAQAPTLNITSPASSISSMPVSISATYTDTSGTCQAASFSLQSNGREVYSGGMTITESGGTTTLSASLTASDFLPDNGKQYTVVITARSSSSLQSTANATFTTAFTEPQAGTLGISNDPDTGYVSLLATFDNHATDVEYSGATNAQFDTTEGYVRSLTVEGQSQKWNQKVHDGFFPNSSPYWQTHNGCSEVVSDNTITMTTTVDGTSIGKNNFLIQNIPFDGSHKYYVGIDGKGSRTATLAMYYVATSGTNRRTDFVFTTADTWTHFGSVKTFADTSQTFTQIRVQNYTTNLVTGDVFSFRNFIIVDLTDIYGAGNEPSAETFEASRLYETKYAPNATAYDAGSLVSIGGSVERWNQLFDNAAPSENVNGTTFTNNEDGTWNVTGAYSSNPFKYVTDVPMQPSHQLLVMQGTNPSNAYVRVGFDSYVGATWRNTKIASGTMEILSSYSACDNIKPFVYVDGGWIATDDIKLTPRIIDLTAIYGAGNEPTSTSDARITALATYAATHYDYEANGVMDTSTGGVEVRGRNLLDPTLYTGIAYNPTVGTQVTLTESSTQFTVNDDMTVFTIDTTSTWKQYTMLFPCRQGEQIYVNVGFSSTGTQFGTTRGYLDSDMHILYKYNNTDNPHSITGSINPPEGAAWYFIVITNRGGATSTITVTNPMVSYGIGQTAYEPYSLITIPAILRSAGSIHDQLQVDKTDVQVARNVTALTLNGTESWSVSTTNGGLNAFWLSNSTITDASAASRLRVAAGYTSNEGDWHGFADKTVGVPYNTLTITGGILFVDSAYASVDAWKAALTANPKVVHFAAGTPTAETLSDISLIKLGTAATVLTDLDSTFTMTGWDGSADAVSISVARVNADGLTPLITDGASGAGAVDKYAPLNTPYQYAVTTMSAAHAVNTVYVENILVTDRWFAYWQAKEGDALTDNLAWAKWNPEGSYSITRPEKKRVHYAGRKWAVSYDSKAMDQSHGMTWAVVDLEDWENGFLDLMDDGGRGVYKSCDGLVFHADFDYSATPNYQSVNRIGKLSLTITRIDGEQL